MNRQAAVDYLAGTIAGWLGIGTRPSAAEKAVVTTFGERVMLAYEMAEDELSKVREKRGK